MSDAGINVPPHVQNQVEALAKRLNTTIPGGIPIIVWALPILTALTEQKEKQEADITNLRHNLEAMRDELNDLRVSLGRKV